MGHAITKRVLLVAASILVLPFLAQTAHADNYVDFSCSGPTCQGTVTQTGSYYSSTGINGLVQDASGGPDYLTGAFDLVFDTSAGTIDLIGNDPAGDDVLLGSIVGATPTTVGSQTVLELTVDWTTLSPDFQSYLNASSASSLESVIYINTSGDATSSDFTVTPTPEPASFSLLGIGVLALCGLLRRKALNVA